jgi:hypothetical protein
MAPLSIPSYITDYLPKYIANYLHRNIPECTKLLDNIENQCVPLSSVVAAISIYSIIALLLSWWD